MGEGVGCGRMDTVRCSVNVSVQAVVLAGVVGLGACSSEPRMAETGRTSYVDGGSVGGVCSDARRAAQNTVRAPWCSLAVAFARAPSGSAVRVRRGTYPRVVLPYYAPARRVTFSGYGDERPNLAGVTIGSATAPVLTRNLRMQHLRLTGSVNVAKFDSIDTSQAESALPPAAPTTCSSTTRSCDVHTPNGLTATAPGSHLTFRGNYVH